MGRLDDMGKEMEIVLKSYDKSLVVKSEIMKRHSWW